MPSKIDKYKMSRKYDRRCRATDEDIESMIRMYNCGITQERIARIFGLSQSTVSYIVSKKSKESLAAYRKTYQNKRRTREEHRNYTRELRAYKRGIALREQEEREERKLREEKMNEHNE